MIPKARSFRYAFVLGSDLHIGSGAPGAGYDDRCAVDVLGRPIIPASTVKGAARDALVRGGVPESDLILAFGAEDRPHAGATWFSDATAEYAEPVGRSFVALSDRRAAVAGRLFELEVVPAWQRAAASWAPTVFRGRVELLPGVAMDEGAHALTLAAEALARTTSFGGRTTRGMGVVRCALRRDDFIAEGSA